MQLVFEKDEHVYRLVDEHGIFPDEIIPSVTQVISCISSFDHVPHDILEDAAWRGKRVHKALEIYNTEGMRLSQEDLLANLDDVLGYVNSGIKFNEEHVTKVNGIEIRKYGKLGGHKFAGTIDIHYNDTEIADYKTGKSNYPAKESAIQGAGYLALMGSQMRFKIPKLCEDGSYILFELIDDLTATEIFYGCLQAYYGEFEGDFGKFLKQNYFDNKPLMRRMK